MIINIICTIAIGSKLYRFEDVHTDKSFHEQRDGIYFWIENPNYLKSKDNYGEYNGKQYKLECKRVK